MKRIAVIGAILEDPQKNQPPFNAAVSSFKGIVKGRMGLPFDEAGMAVVSLTVVAQLDVINSLTGRLGRLPGVSVKTAISERTVG